MNLASSWLCMCIRCVRTKGGGPRGRGLRARWRGWEEGMGQRSQHSCGKGKREKAAGKGGQTQESRFADEACDERGPWQDSQAGERARRG